MSEPKASRLGAQRDGATRARCFDLIHRSLWLAHWRQDAALQGVKIGPETEHILESFGYIV